MKTASDIVTRLLAVLLIVAAALKGWQLVIEPVANGDLWSYRPFLIFTVEFELALGLWLLSGLFKKAGWLAILLCFSAFSTVILYKALTGAPSYGWFGKNKHIRLLYCQTCKNRFSERKGTPLFRMRIDEKKAISLLRHICEGWPS